MGLLEKALEFKKEVNNKGRETLIDRIQGPAETELLEEVHLSASSAESEGSSETLETTGVPDDELFQLPPDDGMPPVHPPEEGDVADDGFEPDITAMTTPEKPGRPQGKALPPAQEGPLGSEDEPDLSVVRKRIKSLLEDEIIDAELDITIFDDDGAVQTDVSAAEIEEPLIGAGSATSDGSAEYHAVVPGPGEGLDKKRTSAVGMKEPEEDGKESAAINEENFNRQISNRAGKTLSHNKKFHDFMVLYEIGKEIVRAENLQALYDIIVFSIMGQIGVSSTTILAPSKENENLWVIAESRGIQLRDSTIVYSAGSGILGSLGGRRSVIDLDEYKDKPGHQEEYFKLISIDARLLCPLSYNSSIFGAIVLGEKISIGDYTDAEKDFILSVSEISAMALEKMRTIDSLGASLETSEREVELTREMDDVVEKTGGSIDTENLNETITGFCEKAGLLSFGLFLYDSQTNEYVPDIVDSRDSLRIKEDELKIQKSSPLIDLISNSLNGIVIEDFKHHESVKTVFDDNMIMRMTMFRIYPVKSGGELIGFLGVFALREEFPGPGTDFIVHRSAGTLIRAMYIRKNIIQAGRYYMDIVDSAMIKIEDSFQRARDLNIPLSFVLFSIKNLKRYYSLYGRDEAALLLRNLKNIILSRLSDTDFAVRLDRHKVLLVLPGKNKKFAVPLANAIRNELVQSFRKKEMQLMLVYLSASYPEDGDDVYALLENLE